MLDTGVLMMAPLLTLGETLLLTPFLAVQPIKVNHRGEYSDTVAFRIQVVRGVIYVWGYINIYGCLQIELFKKWSVYNTRIKRIRIDVYFRVPRS
jgi:hypothetical protein